MAVFCCCLAFFEVGMVTWHLSPSPAKREGSHVDLSSLIGFPAQDGRDQATEQLDGA
jgi:hypothetical protein